MGIIAVRDYYPGADLNVMHWLEHFTAKLPNYVATFGLSGGQLTQVQTHFDTIKQKLAEVEAAKSILKSIVAAKEQALSEAETFIRNLVATLKIQPNYTQAIGEDLNVIGSSEQDEQKKMDSTCRWSPSNEIEPFSSISRPIFNISYATPRVGSPASNVVCAIWIVGHPTLIAGCATWPAGYGT